MNESLSILYRDNNLVAVNKPAGLLVHKSVIDRHETQYAMKILRNQLDQWVYPIHRLDKPTSGVLLFALSSEIARLVCECWSSQVQKRYLAVVRGWAAEAAQVDHPLREHHDKMADKKAKVNKPPQSAVTHFQRLAKTEIDYCVDKYPRSRYSLLACSPKTGRKHQIRRHLKHISHPIIGDAKYGKGIHNRFFEHHFDCHRLLLHAERLQLPHPITNQTLTINAPLDERFHRVIDGCGWNSALNKLTVESRHEAG